MHVQKRLFAHLPNPIGRGRRGALRGRARTGGHVARCHTTTAAPGAYVGPRRASTASHHARAQQKGKCQLQGLVQGLGQSTSLGEISASGHGFLVAPNDREDYENGNPSHIIKLRIDGDS